MNLDLEGGSDFGVKHQNQSGTNGTEGISTSSLEQGGNTFVLHDLCEAVSRSLVVPFILGLLGLHLQTTTDRVERVRRVTGSNGRELRTTELGGGTQDVRFVLLVRVVSREGVEETEVDTTVGDDTNNGYTNTVVERGDTSGFDSLREAVHETAELLLAGTDIRGKTGTGVVEGVDNQ